MKSKDKCPLRPCLGPQPSSPAPPAFWWVYVEGDGLTENNMCRSMYTGRYYKLIHDATDYYGIDSEDPHSYPIAQY